MTLAEYLDESKRTHEELARAVGCNTSSVTRWVGGDRVPAVWYAVAIQRATKGAVPVTVWQPLPSSRRAFSRRVMPAGKPTKRARNARTAAHSPDISRGSRSRRHPK